MLRFLLIFCLLFFLHFSLFFSSMLPFLLCFCLRFRCFLFLLFFNFSFVSLRSLFSCLFPLFLFIPLQCQDALLFRLISFYCSPFRSLLPSFSLPTASSSSISSSFSLSIFHSSLCISSLQWLSFFLGHYLLYSSPPWLSFLIPLISCLSFFQSLSLALIFSFPLILWLLCFCSSAFGS